VAPIDIGPIYYSGAQLRYRLYQNIEHYIRYVCHALEIIAGFAASRESLAYFRYWVFKIFYSFFKHAPNVWCGMVKNANYPAKQFSLSADNSYLLSRYSTSARQSLDLIFVWGGSFRLGCVSNRKINDILAFLLISLINSLHPFLT
jgi:hypothetical protein